MIRSPIAVSTEYCPYCGRDHYRVRVGPWTARYGCSEEIATWQEGST